MFVVTGTAMLALVVQLVVAAVKFTFGSTPVAVTKFFFSKLFG
jgi:hypothetical protein